MWYTKDEVAKLIGLSTDVFMREDLADIIQFAAYTGMRQGEILKIRAKDIDFESNHSMSVVYQRKQPRLKTGELFQSMTVSGRAFTYVVHK